MYNKNVGSNYEDFKRRVYFYHYCDAYWYRGRIPLALLLRQLINHLIKIQLILNLGSEIDF